MNWSKAKVILIFLFLCLNIFLVSYIINTNRAVSIVSEQTIMQVKDILSSNNVYVDISKVPNKIPVMREIDAYNAILDFDELANKLLGGKYNKTNNDRLYINGSKRMAVQSDSFNYENDQPIEYYPALNEANAVSEAKKIAKRLGFDIENTLAKIIGVEDGVFEVGIVKMIKGYPLFDSTLVIKLSKNGLNGMKGAWFSQSRSASIKGLRIKPATSALIDFINYPKRFKETTVQITDITLGYLSGDTSTYHKSITAVPTWRITTAEGDTFYLDARVR